VGTENPWLTEAFMFIFVAVAIASVLIALFGTSSLLLPAFDLLWFDLPLSPLIDWSYEGPDCVYYTGEECAPAGILAWSLPARNTGTESADDHICRLSDISAGLTASPCRETN
jgi:hypothetical protein